MSSQNYTEKAVKAAGKSLSEVARRFGFKSTQSVANWVINNQVPSERVLQLCELGNWSVTPHECVLIFTPIQMMDYLSAIQKLAVQLRKRNHRNEE